MKKFDWLQCLGAGLVIFVCVAYAPLLIIAGLVFAALLGIGWLGLTLRDGVARRMEP